MGRSSDQSRSLAKAVGFFDRAIIRRPFRKKLKWGEDLERRATLWLVALNEPSQGLGFRARLESLACEYDLFVEDYTSIDSCLALQARVFQLADEFPAAAAICRNITESSLAENVLASILASAKEVQASLVKIAMSEEGSIHLQAEIGSPTPDWPTLRTQAMKEIGCDVCFFSKENRGRLGTLMVAQAESIVNVLRRIDAVGYADYKQYMDSTKPLPAVVQIEWESPFIVSLVVEDVNPVEPGTTDAF